MQHSCFQWLVFFCGDFTLRLHVLILRIVLINLLAQLYLVYKIWVHIPKSLSSVSFVI
jgi:hypothetical protein